MTRVAVVVVLCSVMYAACTPSRLDMQKDANGALPEALRSSTRWIGADDDKDRAVSDAVRSLVSRPITPDEAAEIALIRHRRVQLAYESLGIAQADLVDAGLLSNPSLHLGVHAHPVGPPAPIGFEFGVDWPFLSVLFLAQRTSIAEARRDAQKALVVDEVIAVAADARRKALTAAATKEIAAVMLAAAEAAEGSVVLVRENTLAGNHTPLDLALEELRYQQALLDAADAERDATVALEALKEAMGLFGGEGDVRVVSFSSLPALPVPGNDATVDPRALEQRAVERSFRLIAGKNAIDAAARELGYANAQRFLPNLGLSGEADLDGFDQSVGAGVNVTVPLFNMGQGEMLRRESLLRQQAAMVQRDAVALRALARQTATNADLSRRRAHQIQTAVMPQHRVVVDEIERRVNGMIVFPTALFEARRAMLLARRQELEAMHAARLLTVDVEQLQQGGTPAAVTMTTSSAPASAPQESGGH